MKYNALLTKLFPGRIRRKSLATCAAFVLCAVLSLVVAACTQDLSNDARSTTAPLGSGYDTLHMELNASVVADNFSAPVPMDNNETTVSAANTRAVTYSSGTVSNDLSTITTPKFVTAGDRVRFIVLVRSSTPGQPINRFESYWKRVGNKYFLEHQNERFSLVFNPALAVGNLSFRLIAGGDYNAATGRLTFADQFALCQPDASGVLHATLDVPYFSDWTTLNVEREQGGSGGVVIRFKGDVATSNEPDIHLKPQGILLQMRMENEMFEDGMVRKLMLKKLYFRSTAYGGRGYYDLNSSTLTAATNTANDPVWNFTDINSTTKETTTTFTLTNPLKLEYNATGNVVVNSYRGLRDYPLSPYAVCWMMPTGMVRADLQDDATAASGLFKVRSEVFAEVEDARTEQNPSSTVYSNKSGVDKEEAAGRIVVPSMKALPVYASHKLTSPTGEVPFANGTAYSLTLNFQRSPIPFDLLSEYELNASGNGFTDSRYQNVGFFGRVGISTSQRCNAHSLHSI